MEPNQPDRHFLEASRDFIMSRTRIEKFALGAIVLLAVDFFFIELRATTLLLIAVAAMPWWLPHFRSYLREEEPETDMEKSGFDETDDYGA